MTPIVYFITDCSLSYNETLNTKQDKLQIPPAPFAEWIREIADTQPEADYRLLAFSGEPRPVRGIGENLKEDLAMDCLSNIGGALEALRADLAVRGDRAEMPLLLVLFSDGMSTDDWQEPLHRLEETGPWKRAVRRSVPGRTQEGCNAAMLSAFSDRIIYGRSGMDIVDQILEVITGWIA